MPSSDFVSILFATLSEQCKALSLPHPDGWRKAEKAKDGAVDPPLEADDAADLVDKLKQLTDAFVQLVQSTKAIRSATLNKVPLPNCRLPPPLDGLVCGHSLDGHGSEHS
jgi:hypothetical protein